VTANKSVISNLVAGPNTGWGVSLGAQYEIPIQRALDFNLGVSWQEIGDMSFGNDLSANAPPRIRSNLSAGGAMVYRLSGGMKESSTVKFSVDFRHINETNIDPRLRLHVGSELDLGIVSFQAGLNQDSLTFGAGINIWFFNIQAVSYGVENQSLAFMDRERRYMVQSVLSFELDAPKKTGRDSERKKHPRTSSR
jgi:hypothetical protein